MIGTTIGGQYRIDEEIGRGAMGIVYRGEDLKLHRPVAVKFLQFSGLGNAETIKKVLKEARTLAAVEHPAICPIYNVIENEDSACLVMGFVDGQSLKAHLDNQGHLEWREVLRLVLEASEGLHAAHLKGIVHRDIKPENLMLDADGHLKVMDFGVARRQDATLATIEGGIAGTAAYMAPEQWRGDKPDARTDIWGLGAVLFEMLTRKSPFAAEFPEAAMYSILNTEPAPLADYRDDLPEDLQRVLNRMLMKDPAQRYPDMAALGEDLDGLLAGGRAVGGSDSRGGSGSVPSRLVRPGITAAILLALGIGVWQSAVHWGGPDGPPPDPSRVLVLPLANRTSDPALDNLGVLAAETMTEELGGIENLEVLPVPAVEPLSRGADSEARRRAAEFGAGTIVTGSYFQAGSELTVQLQVSVAGMDSLLFTVPRATGPASSPMVVFGEAMDRLLGGMLLNVASKHGEPVHIAPRYEAAREYLTGLILMGSGKHVPALHRSALLDTTFLYPALWLVGEIGEAVDDSLAAVFDRRRSQYSPYEASRITAAFAQIKGNNEGALAAIQDCLAEYPGDPVAMYKLVSLAHATNRPSLGIRTYRDMQVPPGWETSLALEFQGGRVADMYCWLEDYEGMLAHVEEMLKVWPGTKRILAKKMAALAGLGRYAAVDSVTLELISSPGAKGQVPYVMEIALRHLAVRERWDEARLMADRGQAWLDSQGPDDMDADIVSFYWMYLEQHTNRWARLDSLLALDPDPYENWYPLYLRFPGRAAAQRGDRKLALEICELIKPREAGYMGHKATRDFANRCLHERAAIRALLGDKEAAVALLREAFRRGWFRHGYVDPDPAFVGLYDYEPYRELMKPRG